MSIHREIRGKCLLTSVTSYPFDELRFVRRVLFCAEQIALSSGLVIRGQSCVHILSNKQRSPDGFYFARFKLPSRK